MGYLRFGGFDDGGGFSFLVGVLWMVEGGGRKRERTAYDHVRGSRL